MGMLYRFKNVLSALDTKLLQNPVIHEKKKPCAYPLIEAICN